MVLGPLRFTNASGGTGDFAYRGPAIDMQSPASAGAVDGTTYLYYAQSLDMSQWEIGTGAYTAASKTFARTTVQANSLGTTAKINFGNPPQVFVLDTFNEFAASPLRWTRTILASGSGTYTTPAGATAIRIRMVGGGGGAGGSGTSPGTGSAGGNTTFGSLTADGGGGGGFTNPFIGTGGGATGGDINIAGGRGCLISMGYISETYYGGPGGNSAFGGAGETQYTGAGLSAAPNSGSGGGSGFYAGTGNTAAGGGAGGYCEKLITSPASSYSYAVGAGGNGGAAGTSGYAGGAGGSGIIIIDEYY